MRNILIVLSMVVLSTGCTTTKYIVKDNPVSINIDKNLFLGCKKPKKLEDLLGSSIDKATDDKVAAALAEEHLEHIACYKTVHNAYTTLNKAQKALIQKIETK